MRETVFGLLQGPQLTMEQSQITICDPDPKQVIPEGIASLVDWVKATLRSVYPDNGDCPPDPINAKRNIPSGADGMIHI